MRRPRSHRINLAAALFAASSISGCFGWVPGTFLGLVPDETDSGILARSDAGHEGTRDVSDRPDHTALDRTMCSPGRTLCGAECVDTQSDPRHCGWCNHGCAEGQVCAHGTCDNAGDCRETSCTGFTYCDLGTGVCRAGCIETQQCGANEQCEVATHTCACLPWFHRCSGACVSDFSTDHCNQSCTPCPTKSHGTVTCDGQQCGIDCLAGYHDCGGTCVADDHPDHCGDRCAPCPTDPLGVPACVSSSCGVTCNPGNHLCSGVCVSNSEFDHCGDRCTPCPGDPAGDPICVEASCSLACHPTYHLCDLSCVTDDDVDHCGDRCDPCPTSSLGTSICSEGTCSFDCNEGSRLCDYLCDGCPSRATLTSCAGGSCVATQCTAAYAVCGDDCCNWFESRLSDEARSPVALALRSDGVHAASYVSTAETVPAGVYWAYSSSNDTLAVEGVTSGRTSLAFTSSARPVIAFYDGERGLVEVARKPGASWEREVVPDTGTYGVGLALALDAEDRAHLSYFSETEGQVHYAREQESGWQIEQVAAAPIATSVFTSVHLDSEGSPVVAFSRADVGTVGVARPGTDSWTVDGPDAMGAESGTCGGMALSADNRAHLVFYKAQGGDLLYAVKEGSVWTTSRLSESVIPATEAALCAGIALDRNGEPHIAFTVWGSGTPTGSAIMYATKRAGEWLYSIIDYWDYSWPRIAIEENGDVHIATTRVGYGFTNLKIFTLNQP